MVEQHTPRAAWSRESLISSMRTLDTGRPPVSYSLACVSGALHGSTTLSLATRGNLMDNQNISKPNPEATLEVVSSLSQSTPSEKDQDYPTPANASGTLEVPMHSQEEVSMDAEDTSSSLVMEEDLLKSPGTPQSTGTLDDATEQLSNLKVKRRNLTTAERREALKAKLQAKGEAFDPAKWRRGKKKKTVRPEAGETPGPNVGPNAEARVAKRPRGAMSTPPSAEGPAKKARGGTGKDTSKSPANNETPTEVSYRDVAATKMAIVLEGFPEAKLSAEQGDAIEDAIMDEIQPLEDGSYPSFAGTYTEKGALIISCITDTTKRWLEELVPRLKPLGEDTTLKVGSRKDILRSTRVFFRAHPKLLKKTPEKVLEMLDKQNPSLKVKEWKVLPAKPDPKGYGFVCFLDEVCFKAVRSANSRANLGLWQVSLVSTTLKDNAKGPTDQPASQ